MPMTKQERDELRAKADDPKFGAHVYREVLVPVSQLRELLDGAERKCQGCGASLDTLCYDCGEKEEGGVCQS